MESASKRANRNVVLRRVFNGSRSLTCVMPLDGWEMGLKPQYIRSCFRRILISTSTTSLPFDLPQTHNEIHPRLWSFVGCLCSGPKFPICLYHLPNKRAVCSSRKEVQCYFELSGKIALFFPQQSSWTDNDCRACSAQSNTSMSSLV